MHVVSTSLLLALSQRFSLMHIALAQSGKLLTRVFVKGIGPAAAGLFKGLIEVQKGGMGANTEAMQAQTLSNKLGGDQNHGK